MVGFAVKINGTILVSVSNEGLNILYVRLSGDVHGPELAAIEVIGGYYGGDRENKHLTWISDHEITSKDKIEIEFSESVTTSFPGKTIEELYPAEEEQKAACQSMDELFSELSEKPKTREKFLFNLTPSTGEPIQGCTDINDWMFHMNVMWKWLHPDKASVWLTSNSLEGIHNRTDGTSHAKLSLQLEETLQVNIKEVKLD